MEEEYLLLDDDYQETKIYFVKTKQEKEELQLRWLVSYDDITLEKVIGKGSFGEVWRGRWQNKIIAVIAVVATESYRIVCKPLHARASVS